MKKTTLSILVASLFASPALAQQAEFTGSLSVTGIASEVNAQAAQKNPYIFEKYRDLSDGVTGGTDLWRNDEGGRMRLFSENLGRDDQFIELSGNRYGFLKYSLYNNNIVHNLTFNAITPFEGIGTNNLTFPGALGATPSTNTATWNRFDYGIKHENYGGMFEITPWRTSPYYFRATANQKKTEGAKMAAGYADTSPGGPFTELPIPINYTTTDVSAEVGYSTKTTHYSLLFSWSKFEDDNNFFTWRNPAITNAASTTTTETSSIAADNELWRMVGNAVWKQLPMASTLALRGTYAVGTSSVPVQTSFTTVSGTTGTVRQANPNVSTFEGEVIHTSLSASLNSQIARSLDSRVYLNWNQRENESTEVVFTPTGGNGCDFNPVTGAAITPPTCTNELFHYERYNLGIDLQYRLTPQNKFSGGWDYANIERERHDFHESDDNKVYVEWKNNSLEDLQVRLKYQYLQRRSEFGWGDINPALSNTNLFRFYLKPFDANDLNQDLVKLALDSSPARFLDLGAELIYKNNSYQNVDLGRTGDTRKELYLSAAYGDPKAFRVSAFFDYETTQYDSTHYQGTPSAATFPAAVSATAFEWKGQVEDQNYVLGIAADWLPHTRLRFRGSYIYQETEGTVDFSANTTAAVIRNIPNYDSFTKHTFDLRAIYALTRSWEVTVGGAYEKYKYDDAQFANYTYTIANSFLTGAYAFPDYEAVVGYLTLKYYIR
jgi:MtrB/PioB family decaheme-associated outer membrane protein